MGSKGSGMIFLPAGWLSSAARRAGASRHRRRQAVMEIEPGVLGGSADAGSEEGRATVAFATATVSSLLFPFAPHLSAEVYESVKRTRVWGTPWPKSDPALLARDVVKMVVQVNGKVRDRITVGSETTDAEIFGLAASAAGVIPWIEGKEIKSKRYVPKRLVNFSVA